MLVTAQGVVEAAFLRSDRDLATFVDGLKTVKAEPGPKRRGSAIRGTFDFPAVSRAGTFRIAVAAVVALAVFVATLVGLTKYFQTP